jgi:hypothetical protein
MGPTGFEPATYRFQQPKTVLRADRSSQAELRAHV